MGWIGRKYNVRPWYVPISKRSAWTRQGYRLVRTATPEEDALYAAYPSVSPVPMARLLAHALPREPAEGGSVPQSQGIESPSLFLPPAKPAKPAKPSKPSKRGG